MSSACEIVNLEAHASKLNRFTVILDYQEMQDSKGNTYKVGQKVTRTTGKQGKIHRFRQSGNAIGADVMVKIGNERFLYFQDLDELS